MKLKFVTLDVFTSTPLYGNPVAILHVPAGSPLTQNQKQLIAREFNLSESVFLHEQTGPEREAGDVRIDIFTALAEVPFAGHPTVGTANYLLRHLKVDSAKALQAKAGRIPIVTNEDGSGIQLAVAHNVRIHQYQHHNQGFPRSPFPVVSIVKGMTFILAKMASLDELNAQTQNLLGTPNTYTSVHLMDEGWQAGILVTYFYCDLGLDDNGTRQVRTRSHGSREDPATGSAASALCSYLSLSEEGPLIRKFHIIQGVEMGRRSNIYIEVTLKKDGKEIERVLLSGTAVKIMEGVLEIRE